MWWSVVVFLYWEYTCIQSQRNGNWEYENYHNHTDMGQSFQNYSWIQDFEADFP